MKYQIGQKVLLKNNLDTTGWYKSVKEEYDKLDTYVVTIIAIENQGDDYYKFKEITLLWADDEVEGLYIEPKPIYNPINSRFEILDIRE